ncbi:MAG: type II toxin-antitoxin system VapC family toxin [Desulfobacterota bacterium]|nr:type II toxin-antitoxin system VapC family toxin [Thermodesulfobacteriota bacterium]
MKPPFILDSFALLNFLHKEPGWEKVKSLLADLAHKNEKAFLSRINWGEFYYILHRRVGRDKTLEALSLLDQLPIAFMAVDDSLVRKAAEIKAEYPIAYADAFCTALAQRMNGRILTGDPKFKAVEQLVAVEWLGNQ